MILKLVGTRTDDKFIVINEPLNGISRGAATISAEPRYRIVGSSNQSVFIRVFLCTKYTDPTRAHTTDTIRSREIKNAMASEKIVTRMFNRYVR